jgi:hypothetical protein
MVENELARTANDHLAIELGADTRTTEVSAYSMHRLSSNQEGDVKTRLHAARSEFKFPDAL